MDIIDNSAAFGGGIWARSDITVTDSTISGNSAAFGGGIETHGNVYVAQSTIADNSANFSSGGISAFGVTVTKSTISGNSANFGSGGGISASSVTVTKSTISDNSARRDGGGISAGGVTVTQSTITGNSASDDGGGIRASGNVNVTQSTIFDNSAAVGGGIWIWATSDIHLTSSIVALNSASTGPDLNKTPATLFQSLVGNIAGTSLVEARTPGVNGNLIGTPENPLDPLLAPLAENGGPTETHALLLGSPAIDVGNLATVPDAGNAPLYDQRGAPFNRVSGGRIDMGAYELQSRPGDANRDLQFDQLDIVLVLQAARYLTGQRADWSEGDWNGVGVFDQLDIVAALQTGNYLQGRQAARQNAGGPLPKTEMSLNSRFHTVDELFSLF